MRESPPTFETERLHLRAVGEDDIAAWAKHFVDYEMFRHLNSSLPWPYPEDGRWEFVSTISLPNQGKDRWSSAICLREEPRKLIGVVELWRPGTPNNRGFWPGRRYRGQGLMREALAPIVDYAFDDLRFKILVLEDARGNVRSSRIKAHEGAKLVPIEPASYVDAEQGERFDGEPTDR